MNGLRKTACGLTAVVCLLVAAPVAWAGPMDTPLVLTDAGAWMAGWVERIAGWLGRSAPAGPGGSDGGRLRPVVEHSTCGLDPTGVPRPCPPVTAPEAPEGRGVRARHQS